MNFIALVFWNLVMWPTAIFRGVIVGFLVAKAIRLYNDGEKEEGLEAWNAMLVQVNKPSVRLASAVRWKLLRAGGKRQLAASEMRQRKIIVTGA